jgi:hypothetical protein
LLIKKLLPLLEGTAARPGETASRVVHLTSGAHRGAPVSGVPLTLMGVNDPSIGPYARYGMAKVDTVLKRWGGLLTAINNNRTPCPPPPLPPSLPPSSDIIQLPIACESRLIKRACTPSASFFIAE